MELKQYKIGEIAQLAGVSKRTVDYYTNIGLLNPSRSENNYRYYSDESLVRLKVIEAMKTQRYTLEEIRERLSLFNHNKLTKNESKHVTISYIKEQIKQLESQLTRLQPAVANMDQNQAELLSRQILLQSMTLMNALMVYINEVTLL